MFTNNRPKANTFCRSKLAAAVSLAILLAGCGSDGESADVSVAAEPATDIPTLEQPASPELQAFSGKAADGYLSGALVCLDLDNDSLCGSDEPFSITGSGGAYEFKELNATIDLSQVRLLVKVIADQTIDEDNPGVPVTHSYNMSSPPGQIDFVSPITTLIDNQMQTTQGQTQAEAEQVVAQLIGINDSDAIDLTGDYVEAKKSEGESSESNQQYQRLHHVAQAVATAIGVVSDDLKEQLSDLDATQQKDALAAIVNNVVEGLGEITTAIDQAAATTTNDVSNDSNDSDVKPIDIKAIVEAAKGTIAIAEEDLAQAIGAVKDQRDAIASNIKDVLTQQGGIFFLEQDKEQVYNEETNKCIVEAELGYGNFKVTDNVAEFSFKLYNPATKEFITANEQDDHDVSVYTLGKAGWTQNEHDQSPTVNFSDDGVKLTLKMPRDGHEKIHAREFEIAGEPVATIARDQWIWRKALQDNDFTFTDEAKAYLINGELLENHFVLPVWNCDDSSGVMTTDNCNSVRFGHDYQIASNFEQLITSAAPSEQNMLDKAFHIYLDGQQELMISLFKFTEDSEEKQIVKFFVNKYDTDHSHNNSQQTELVHVGKWQQKIINGQSIILLDVPKWLNNHDHDNDIRPRTPFITIQDGQVRQGIMLNKGFTDHKAVAMNKAAMEQVLSGFDAKALRMELEPERCGVAAKKPQEPNNPQDPIVEQEQEQEQEPAPELVSDLENTQALAGNSYFINNEDEQILVRFKADGMVNVAFNEQHFDDKQYPDGQDSDGQHADGQHADGQHSDGQHADGQHADGQHADGQHADGQHADGQHPDGQYHNGEYADEHDRHVDTGKWTIDADGQLLLEFSHEWLLLNVEQGLGSPQLVVTEKDEDGVEEFILNKIKPLSVNELNINTPLTLTRADDCSLEFQLAQAGGVEGTISVNASNCLKISEDMGADQFEMAWFSGEKSELVLKVATATGETHQEMIHLFSVVQGGQPHVLMIFEKSAADGTMKKHHNFELWQVAQPK